MTRLGGRGSGGECPGACGGTKRSGQIACGLCWGRVPVSLRAAVVSAARELRAAPTDPTRRAALRRAEDTALEALGRGR